MARILVIDDEPAVRESFSWALKSAHHEVLLVANGKDALQKCRIFAVDLVLADIFMPESDGLETILELHQEFPNIPIMAYSCGHIASDPAFAIARKLGAADAFEIPFNVGQLLASVNKMLGAAPAHERYREPKS